MKVLVTGGSGMVGRNLIESLTDIGHEVHGPSRSELDLLELDAVRGYVAKLQPDLVVHAAGLVGGIQANIERPVEFLVVNTRIGVNIVEAAFGADVPRFLNLGSSCMYPKAGINPLAESQILTGQLEPTNEAYALAKITIARLCQYLDRQHSHLFFKTLIPCNLYGRYDHFDPEEGHMIAAVMRRMDLAVKERRDSITIWGDGSARREFMYVGDLAEFVAHFAERIHELPEVINVGLGRDYTVKEYYQALAEVIGFHGRFEYDLNKPVGMRQKLIDTSRQRQLGWTPSTSLSEGVQRTYEYYKTVEVE